MALPKFKRQITTRAGTGRNATECICIKRVSLSCWLLGVTEARISLGNGDLQASSIIPPICIKLPFKKIKQQKKCELMFIVTCALASSSVCDRLFQKSVGGAKPVVFHHLHSNVSKCFPLGLMLSNTFIKDLDAGTEHVLSKSADDTQLGAVADRPEGGAAVQRDLSRLGTWAERSLKKFSKWKCRVLSLGRNSPRHQGRLGPTCWEAALQKRPSGSQWTPSWWALAAKADSLLGCLRQRISCRWREMVLPLCSALVRHTWSAGSGAGLPSTREMWTYWRECSKGLQQQLKVWSIWHVRRGWKGQDCSAWRRPGSRGFLTICTWLPGGQRCWSQTLFCGFQRQWAQTEIQEIPFKNKKKLFYCGVDWRLEWAAQRGWGISILGDIQNLTGHSLEQPALVAYFSEFNWKLF